VGSVIIFYFGDVESFYFLVTGRGHFQGGGKICPQLETVHAAGLIAFRHFLVDDAAAGGHPLHIAGGDSAAIAHAVPVFNGSG
jgi:hypothetical protein